MLNCPDGFWRNLTTHNCDACTPGCLTCTASGLNYCQSCTNVSITIYYKYLTASTCALSCPAGQFIDANIPNLCQPCASNCITCAGAAENCTNTNCSVNFYFLNNSCLSLCPTNNYYADPALRQCLACASGCLKCFGPALTQCT
jgi:proprotein convertase subtilisin/kexin type 5